MDEFKKRFRDLVDDGQIDLNCQEAQVLYNECGLTIEDALGEGLWYLRALDPAPPGIDTEEIIMLTPDDGGEPNGYTYMGTDADDRLDILFGDISDLDGFLFSRATFDDYVKYLGEYVD